jgi:2-dehydropantoate 2-reductase
VIATKSICIAGAGSIGCFAGGVLAAAGRDVRLLARPRIIEQILSHGLRVTDIDGLDCCVAARQLRLSDTAELMQGVGAVLVTVKSTDTAEIAGLIARHAPDDAVIVSLQNGVGNVAVLSERLPGRVVLGGMVPFNVMSLSDAHFHRATSGAVIVEHDAAGTAAALSVPHFAVRPTDDIIGVQWGKLLINLNNALNALSGLPLREQLAQRAWRVLIADQMMEALAVLKAAGIRPVSPTPVPARMTPALLRLPDALFALVLGRTMKIDASARSSMWEDLQDGRRTEIDYLQGVVVELAGRTGLRIPLTRHVVNLIRRAEQAGKGSPGLTAADIRES